jgi:hypothetical protein
MRRWLLIAGVATLLVSGCAEFWNGPPQAFGPMGVVAYDNPTMLPPGDPQVVWEGMVAVIQDYFRVDREDPMRVIGNTVTQGYLETFPKLGATYLEPWDHDSANSYERLESTLQSIRRRAVVHVIPVQGGYKVDVAVYKDLENLAQPEHSYAGAATFRYDNSLTRVINPDAVSDRNLPWVPVGRDTALEQRIIAQLNAQFGGVVVPRR